MNLPASLILGILGILAAIWLTCESYASRTVCVIVGLLCMLGIATVEIFVAQSQVITLEAHSTAMMGLRTALAENDVTRAQRAVEAYDRERNLSTDWQVSVEKLLDQLGPENGHQAEVALFSATAPRKALVLQLAVLTVLLGIWLLCAWRGSRGLRIVVGLIFILIFSGFEYIIDQSSGMTVGMHSVGITQLRSTILENDLPRAQGALNAYHEEMEATGSPKRAAYFLNEALRPD